MGRKHWEAETLHAYKARMIDNKSESYCGAKWFNATIWLGHGQTASCHHPPGHWIPLEELKDNPTAIHNTKHKKLMRKQMQEGKRPAECEYCWKVEDMGKDHISDRVFKTEIFKDEDLDASMEMPWDENVQLRTLEISFDRACNLKCTYCNPAFSTMALIKISSQMVEATLSIQLHGQNQQQEKQKTIHSSKHSMNGGKVILPTT
jgi:hypothetical protein